jgi:hypothetical protein
MCVCNISEFICHAVDPAGCAEPNQLTLLKRGDPGEGAGASGQSPYSQCHYTHIRRF